MSKSEANEILERVWASQRPLCEGADGLICMSGWLYSNIGMMIFPANKKCPVCFPEIEDE